MFSLLTNPGVVGKGTGVGLALQFEKFYSTSDDL